ncbi:protein of unknown function (plasmid) [Azospirillum baldaniorum]|uniref:Uncharacterized protein n=1 Tax=Azospirillum baldaniorum TaxID=1064539 RepID=A0A9P1NPF1_9PROT|nr:protein of unknown function [Azospirillum baldaniorum]
MAEAAPVLAAIISVSLGPMRPNMARSLSWFKYIYQGTLI